MAVIRVVPCHSNPRGSAYMSLKHRTGWVVATATVAATLAYGISCAPAGSSTGAIGAGDAASKVYVAPGTHDEFYAFLSGGFNGQVGVYGLPSGRLLKIVPVFSQFAENGWGYSEETKPMLETTFGNIPGTISTTPPCRRPTGKMTDAGCS